MTTRLTAFGLDPYSLLDHHPSLSRWLGKWYLLNCVKLTMSL